MPSTDYQRRQKQEKNTAESERQRQSPYGRFEYVRVTFPASEPNIDTLITHSLPVSKPDDVLWEVVGLENPLSSGVSPAVYRDLSPTRVAWGSNYVVLRTNTPGLIAILRLFTRPSSLGLRELDPISTIGSGSQAVSVGGSISSTSGYYERGRSVKMGEWITVSYSSGNFTASAGSWTVDSGDVVRNRYTLVGKTMAWTVALKETDVSSTPAELRIAIPGSFTANAEAGCRAYYAQDAGTVVTDVRASVVPSGTYVSLIRDSVANWTTTSGDNTWVYFTITFEVQ